jgi:ferrochelatase
MSKQAVLLVNLGSPDSTRVADVRRYLHEFLTDERVIDQAFVRRVIVPGFILRTRPKKSAAAYASIWSEAGSPLVVTSRRQRDLLAAQAGMPVHLAMRYGNPSIPDVMRTIAAAGITRLFVIPLYPHYAMSSYETVVVRVEACARELAPAMRVDYLQPFYADPRYIAVLAESIRPHLEAPFDRLIFSYHGVPERHLRKSDPSRAHCLCAPDCCERQSPVHAVCYRHQCFTTTRLVTQHLGLDRGQYMVTFQSRLLRDPWLQPYTDATLQALGEQGVKRVRVVCPAFVTDCLETLEEIAVEGRHTFLAAGGEDYSLIPCLNEHPDWIAWLADRVRAWQATPDAAAHA